MKVLLASNNKHKYDEISAIVRSFGIELVTLKDIGVVLDVEETGSTFEENSMLKARAGLQLTGLPVIADDSGLSVDALNGAPGIYSARYGGPAMRTDVERYKFLLENLKNVNNDQRSATFVCVITFLFPNGDSLIARGECRGTILHAPQGDNGFGYDPIFYVDSEQCSMAQLDPARKNQISHRADALAKLSALLKNYFME